LNWPWLVDAIFHPPVLHVEGFGQLLAHFCIENALGSVVVGVERRSDRWLAMTEFFEHGSHGASVFASDVDSASFGFGTGRNNLFDSLAEDVDGTIDTVTVEPTEVIMDSR
jgi:hypothetical protein